MPPSGGLLVSMRLKETASDSFYKVFVFKRRTAICCLSEVSVRAGSCLTTQEAFFAEAVAAQTVICDICGRYGRYQGIMTYMYFSFFFIPLFKWNKRFYVQMSCCSAIYELEPEIGKAILRGEEPAITSADLHLVQEGKYTRTWQEGSGNPHKKCMRCGFETDEDYNYCPKCGGRI